MPCGVAAVCGCQRCHRRLRRWIEEGVPDEFLRALAEDLKEHGRLISLATTTGAAKLVGAIYPELQGKVDGMAMRVPVMDGSITDLTAQLSREVSAEEINAAFEEAAGGQLSDVLHYSEAPLVSNDIIGSPASCVFDSSLTMANGRTAKVFGWYDNEWGYSVRTCDIVAYIGERL